jgi:hypothetical protein
VIEQRGMRVDLRCVDLDDLRFDAIAAAGISRAMRSRASLNTGLRSRAHGA